MPQRFQTNEYEVQPGHLDFYSPPPAPQLIQTCSKRFRTTRLKDSGYQFLERVFQHNAVCVSVRKISFPLIILTKMKKISKVGDQNEWHVVKKHFRNLLLDACSFHERFHVCGVLGHVSSPKVVMKTLEISCTSSDLWRKKRVHCVWLVVTRYGNYTFSVIQSQRLANNENRSYFYRSSSPGEIFHNDDRINHSVLFYTYGYSF